MKDAMILLGFVLFLVGLLAAAWYDGQAGDQIKLAQVPEQVHQGDLAEVLKKVTGVTTPVPPLADTIHSDLYFDVGRKGLTEEAKAQLAALTEMLKQHEEYGVLIQGYTDRLGSAAYNKQLGLKRGETVKSQLLANGVAEHRMKVVSLGEEGVLCIDDSDLCRHMNRRVHLEIRKVGQEHMALPSPATSSFDLSEQTIDRTNKADTTDPTTERIRPLNSEPSSGS
jgi:outer membrane protein OmpA-like peptidoglycan-associated protein